MPFLFIVACGLLEGKSIKECSEEIKKKGLVVLAVS